MSHPRLRAHHHFVLSYPISMNERLYAIVPGPLIDLTYPRRESEHFHREVMKIRREFFR